MGHIIESDYGFLKSDNKKLHYLLNHFYNLKSSSSYTNYFLNENKNNQIKNSISAMPTFSVDEYLPSLPLPCLTKTLEKYLESVKPFVSQHEFSNTQKVAQEFAKGDGKTLHEFLKQRAERHRNWVCFLLYSLLTLYNQLMNLQLESWWLDWAYLEWRDPIAPFINTSGYLGGSSEIDFQFVPKDFKLDVRLAYIAFQCYYYVHFHDDIRKSVSF